MDRSHYLGEEKIGSLLLKFSIPAIVGMLVNALYTVIDRIFVGQGVGSLAISGIAVAFPIPIMIMAFAMLIGIGATSLISIRLGQRKKEEAELIVGNSFVLLILVSVAISVVGYIFLDPLLIQFGASSEVLPYAKQFTSVLLWGAVFQSIGFGMNNFIRAEGNPKTAMLTMIMAAVFNTILNPIFIFGLRIGVAGSALATVISQFIVSLWVLSYFLGHKSLLKLRWKNLKLDKSIVRPVLAMGMSPFAMQLVASLVTILLNKSLASYGGDLAIAAMGIINSIAMLIFMPVFGINQGIQPIIGYNYGARKYPRVKEALKLGVTWATLLMTLGFLAVEIFPRAIMQLFSANDETLINLGVQGLRIFLLMLPIIGFQVAAANYFQATGKPKKSLLLTLSRQLIFLIPAILFLPRFLGLTGIWLAGPVSDLASALLTAALLVSDLKALLLPENTMGIAEQEPAQP